MVFAAVGGFLLPTTDADQLSPERGVGEECTAAFEPSAVGMGEGSVLVQATLSRDIGVLEEASVQGGGGAAVATAEWSAPTLVRLTLFTGEVEEGIVTIVIMGEKGICSGTLDMEAPPGEPAGPGNE